MAPEDALAAWQARARWPHLALDGVHVHVARSCSIPPRSRRRSITRSAW